MEEEIEILQSIFYDDIVQVDLKCDRPFIDVLIYPSSDEDQDAKKTIVFNLLIYFPQDYPNKIPRFEFKNVRGVSDEDIAKINDEIKSIAERNTENQMLFEIIQYARDYLSNLGTIPKSYKCSICLDELTKSDGVFTLDCYHYFHSACLKQHLSYMEREIESERAEAVRNKLKWSERQVNCPVCREPMKSSQVADLKLVNDSSTSHSFHPVQIIISDRTRRLQREMRQLFERQKLCGGIIDTSNDEIIILNRPSEDTNSQEPDLTNLSLQTT